MGDATSVSATENPTRPGGNFFKDHERAFGLGAFALLAVVLIVAAVTRTNVARREYSAVYMLENVMNMPAGERVNAPARVPRRAPTPNGVWMG